jgi:MFS family permease
MVEMAQMAAGVYAASATASVLTGWVCDRWMQAGAGTNRVRMSAILTGLAGVAACLGVCAIAGPLGSLLAMIGCGVFLGILVPAYFASAQTLAGPGAAARWFGVQNFVANIAGISAPVITGVVVDRTGSFSSAFLIAAVLSLAGIAAFGLIVRRIELIDWHTTERDGRGAERASAGF